MFCRVLSEDDITRIHEATLTILERVGVEVPHEETLTRFADAGAQVDRGRKRVRIPAALVDECLSCAGRQFTIYGRDLARRATFGVGERNYNGVAGEAYWVDEVGAKRRFATLADVATASRICDALQHINIAGAMADPHDLPVPTRCVEVMATMLKHTTKPITFWFHNRASARYLVDLMIALRGNEADAEKYPACYPFLEPISPLRFPHDGIDLLYETARLNLPVPIGPMAQMGLSAPMSRGGTMVQENAEILAGLCITQLIRRGMPVCYGGICHAFDMRTTQLIFSGPEQAVFSVAMTQLGKHYGFPVYINVGLTDSKRPDAQAGAEAGITLALGVAAGADIFGHMGISGVDQATSLDMLMLQHEIIGYVEHTLLPLDLSDEALGLDLIEELGPGGGFLDTMHTAERFRGEMWFPKLLDRHFYQGWLDRGALTTEERCRQRRDELLATHTPEPMPPDQEHAIDEVVAAARRELLG